MTSFGFDVGSTKPQAGFDPLPDGWYDMFIVACEEAVSKAGHPYIKMQVEIDPNSHPQFVNRKVFANFNHQHPNEQTREIARSQLAAICHAIGKPNARNLEEVLGGRLSVRLVAKPAEKGFDARNEAKAFRKIGDTTAAAVPSNVPPRTTTAAPAKRGGWR